MKKYFSMLVLGLLFAAGFTQAQDDSVWVNVWMTRCDGNPVEESLLYTGSTGQLAGSGWRYADNNKMIEYHLNLDWFADLAAEHTLYFRTYVWNEYWIKVSESAMNSITQGEDFATYTSAADTATHQERSGGNAGWHEANLSDYITAGFTDFYVAYFDGRTGDGWGPSIPYIAVAYKESAAKLAKQKLDVTFTKAGSYTLDGGFGDWLPENKWVDVKDGSTNVVKVGTVDANYSGKASLAFVDTMMYVGAQVTDADVTDNDKVVLYFGAYYAWEGLSAGHTPLNGGAVAGYRSMKEPDYKIEIPIKTGGVITESALLNDTLTGASYVVTKNATGYNVEAQIPFKSLYNSKFVKNQFSVYPTPIPGLYGMDDLELPFVPFAFQLVDGGASGFKGSLTTAVAADADENPNSWALVTNTINKYPFEYFPEGALPPTSAGLKFNHTEETAVYIPNPGIMLDTNHRALTMEAWIYAPEWRSGTYQGDVINREDNKTYTLRTGGSGQINANVQASGDLETPSALEGATMKNNVWYHIAVTVAEESQKIYVNGELVLSNDDFVILADPAEPAYVSEGSTLDLVIGNSQAYTDRGFTGTITDVRMWSVARTQDEIKTDMARALTETECQDVKLIGYWPLDEGTGQIAHDKSSYGRHGFLGKGDSVETTDPIWDTDIATVNDNVSPNTFNLAQNYPNPFNPTTNIRYTIPAQGLVKLNIYNVLGQEVKTLVNEVKNAGNHQITWNGDNNFGQKLSSGIYFYRIDFNGNQQMVKKMVFLK